MELWKPIPGLPDYEASNLGQVRSLKFGRTHVLAQIRHHKGYLRTKITQKGKSKAMGIHRLVYSAFVRPLLDTECIDHINRIKDDNRPENLRVATNAENIMNSLSRKNRKRKHLPKGVQDIGNGYTALIRNGDKLLYLGRYKTPEEAAVVYNRKAKELYGDFAYLNEVPEHLYDQDIKVVKVKPSDLPKGVSRSSCKKDSYVARLRHQNKFYRLGSFPTPELASQAYQTKHKELYGGSTPCQV